jgi:hypothetical protein
VAGHQLLGRGDEIVYKKDLNIGIAVALDWG